MKKIGVTTRYNDAGELEVKEQYLNYLNEHDLLPVILKWKDLEIDDRINECDGFLITGGLDIDPIFYGEDDNRSVLTRAEIDFLDRKIVNYCVENLKPLFGICRGMQAINVFLGGSLYQDIPDHQEVEHNLIGDGKFFEEKFKTNSNHHQAIKLLAKDLVPLAWSDDKLEIIEAIKHKKLPIIGVQWHPELDHNSKESKMLMDEFIKLLK